MARREPSFRSASSLGHSHACRASARVYSALHSLYFHLKQFVHVLSRPCPHVGCHFPVLTYIPPPELHIPSVFTETINTGRASLILYTLHIHSYFRHPLSRTSLPSSNHILPHPRLYASTSPRRFLAVHTPERKHSRGTLGVTF